VQPDPEWHFGAGSPHDHQFLEGHGVFQGKSRGHARGLAPDHTVVAPGKAFPESGIPHF